jgi:hypothetical protein
VIVTFIDPPPTARFFPFQEGFIRKFFRWLGFVRPPLFGFDSYNHVNLGEPGEIRNAVEFRLGPKPNINFEIGKEQQFAKQPLNPPAWGADLAQSDA